MGLFDRFKRKNADRYLNGSKFRESLTSQLAMTPKTLEKLRGYGVTSDKKWKVEFFFYSNTLDKVQALAKELNEFGYGVETGSSAGKEKAFIATGWTVPIGMADQAMREWTEHMCTLAYRHDREFDGWGTTTNQP